MHGKAFLSVAVAIAVGTSGCVVNLGVFSEDAPFAVTLSTLRVGDAWRATSFFEYSIDGEPERFES
ncbi:MAG TPA: hypothetical protein VI818_08130, partial [Candidatus Thermoplasmatota archaeon]|nr:hypothetical protein [Candidatus Thermoplasmatota archaeon]